MSENVSALTLTKVQNFKVYIDFKVQKQRTSHISFTNEPYIIYKSLNLRGFYVLHPELFLCTSSVMFFSV